MVLEAGETLNKSIYVLFHQKTPTSAQEQLALGTSVHDLSYVLRYMAVLPKTGEYKVYDAGNYMKRIVTITNHDFKRKS